MGAEERATGEPGEWRDHVGDQAGPPPSEETPESAALRAIAENPDQEPEIRAFYGLPPKEEAEGD